MATESTFPKEVGQTLMRALIEEGVIADNCFRVVIDAECDKVLRVYAEYAGDTRTTEIVRGGAQRVEAHTRRPRRD